MNADGEVMMNAGQDDNISNQENEDIAGEVNESLGLGDQESPVDESSESSESEETEGQLPAYAKARIGKLQKRHARDMRRLQEKVQDLESRHQYAVNPQTQQMPESHYGENPEDHIHRAVRMALEHKEAQERQAKDNQSAAHVMKKYQAFQEHLDNASDKYDDFDDVVRREDANFTPHMRDVALLLPNAADVLYKLGKNEKELDRIAQLHPLDQAKEMVRLSHALANGSVKSPSSGHQMSSIKSNPVSSQNITEKTSVSELRRRMKAGWK